MRKEVRRRHDAHTRTNAVCTENQVIFDVTPGGRKMRTGLNTCVEDTDRLLALQQRSLEEGRAATAQLRQGRSTLRHAVKAVIMVGRLLHLSDTVMGAMRVPGPVGDDELLAYARGLVDRVAPYADAFVAEGLPPDLLNTLEDKIQQVGIMRDAQAAARQRYTTAAQSIRETQDQADRTIDALDAIAVNIPAAHPELLARLRIAKRVGPRLAAPAVKPAPPPVSPAATPPDQAA